MFKHSLLVVSLLCSGMLQAADSRTVDVYRDPNCGCCTAWIKHLQGNGFTVNDHLENNMSRVKTRLGVPPQLASCHTGVIDGRFLEGHVPASDILKLAQHPELLGLAVPGMPVGSPGMEVGEQQDAYQVIGVDRQGQARVFSDYPAR
jgi:hypothetical protein